MSDEVRQPQLPEHDPSNPVVPTNHCQDCGDMYLASKGCACLYRVPDQVPESALLDKARPADEVMAEVKAARPDVNWDQYGDATHTHESPLPPDDPDDEAWWNEDNLRAQIERLREALVAVLQQHAIREGFQDEDVYVKAGRLVGTDQWGYPDA